MKRKGGKTWKIGLAGCGWISDVYAESLKALPNAEIVGCCASKVENAQNFAKKKDLPRVFRDVREMLWSNEIEVVMVGLPNHLHHPVAIEALKAGKHVVIEKPLALSLEQGQDILQTARQSGRQVAYAENICFIPKYVKAKEIAESGQLGKIRFIKEIEKHDGPHTPWFYKREPAGGGALMDMGCHSIEFARWILGKPEVKSVWAFMDNWMHRPGAHPKPTELEDHAVLHLEFQNGASALLESGWTLKGGMVSEAQLHGTMGVLHCELLQEGAGMKMYTDRSGWKSVDADWHRQNGYPQELAHFLDCLEGGKAPSESAEDGLKVLEIMLAAYYSAGTGKKINLPFKPKGIQYPVDLWKNPPSRLNLESSVGRVNRDE